MLFSRKQLIKALIRRGESVVHTTPRHTVMTRKAGDFYFVTLRGMLRVGTDVHTARSLSDDFKRHLTGSSKTY